MSTRFRKLLGLAALLGAVAASSCVAGAPTAVDRGEENEELEEHLTQLVKEVGQLKGGIERITQLETEANAKDRRIHELEGEIGRLLRAVGGADRGEVAQVGVRLDEDRAIHRDPEVHGVGGGRAGQGGQGQREQSEQTSIQTRHRDLPRGGAVTSRPD